MKTRRVDHDLSVVSEHDLLTPMRMVYPDETMRTRTIRDVSDEGYRMCLPRTPPDAEDAEGADAYRDLRSSYRSDPDALLPIARRGRAARSRGTRNAAELPNAAPVRPTPDDHRRARPIQAPDGYPIKPVLALVCITRQQRALHTRSRNSGCPAKKCATNGSSRPTERPALDLANHRDDLAEHVASLPGWDRTRVVASATLPPRV